MSQRMYGAGGGAVGKPRNHVCSAKRNDKKENNRGSRSVTAGVPPPMPRAGPGLAASPGQWLDAADDAWARTGAASGPGACAVGFAAAAGTTIGLAAAGALPQVHRSLAGTPRMALSMWAPQPPQVVLPQPEHLRW